MEGVAVGGAMGNYGPMNSDAKAMGQPSWSVGARVATRHSSDPDLAEERWPVKQGVIVEDHGDVIDSVTPSYGRDRALPLRWAILLDDGPLVFRDDDDLELEGINS